MKPTPAKPPSLRELKSRPVAIIFGVGLMGAVGVGLSFVLEAHPVVETGVVFMGGLLLGGAIAKLNPLVKKWQQGDD